MDRQEFERLRDLPGKVIRGHIRFSQKRAMAPTLVAEGIVIENGLGVDVTMNINYNPEIGSKTLNVTLGGSGPICRLDVDGPPHHDKGRNHKHSLQTPACPNRNLPDNVVSMPDLEGKPVKELFTIFCEWTQIAHEGDFDEPDLDDVNEEAAASVGA